MVFAELPVSNSNSYMWAVFLFYFLIWYLVLQWLTLPQVDELLLHVLVEDWFFLCYGFSGVRSIPSVTVFLYKT